MRRREADGKFFGQGIRGAQEALQDLPHDGRVSSVRIGDFERSSGIPGAEPGGLPDGSLPEIEEKILVRAVHEENQVGPFGKKRTRGPGAMAGKVDAEGAGLPHIVRGGGKIFLVGEAAGGDLEERGGEPALQELLCRRAPAEVAMANHQDPGTVREGQKARAGAKTLFRV